MKFYLQVLKKYAVFSGRANRQEYWMFVLFNAIFCVVLKIFDNIFGLSYTYQFLNGLSYSFRYTYTLYSFAILIPSLAAAVRRLHDINKSGKILLLLLILSFMVPYAIFSSLPAAYVVVRLLCLVFSGVFIWMIVLLCTKGTEGPNKYGADPLAGEYQLSTEAEKKNPE